MSVRLVCNGDVMQFENLKPVKFKHLEEDNEFWKPLKSGETPKGMEQLSGPYYVYAATGHVLNKLFQLEKRLEDHELLNVALEPEKKELYLMAPAAIVYVRKNK
jgi:hypothetical protein